MLFLYKKNLQTAVSITSTDTSPLTDITRLYDTRLSSFVIFVPGDNTVTIHVSFAESLPYDAIGLGGHSFGEGSTMSVNGGAPLPVTRRHAIVEQELGASTEFDIIITDPTMGAGDLRYIGRLEIGVLYRSPDVSSQIKIDIVSNSDALFSSSRQVYGYRRDPYARASFQFPLIDTDQRRLMSLVFQYVDVFVPFLAMLEEECYGVSMNTNYVVLEETGVLSFQLNDAMLYTSSITLSEVS